MKTQHPVGSTDTVADDAPARATPPIAPAAPPNPFVSGRPAALQPGHRVITIEGGDLWMEAEAFVYEMYVKIGYTEPSPKHQVEELARWSDRPASTPCSTRTIGSSARSAPSSAATTSSRWPSSSGPTTTTRTRCASSRRWWSTRPSAAPA